VIPDYCRPVGPGALQGTTVMALALPAPVLDGPVEVAASSPSAPDAVLLLDELSALLASCFGAAGAAGTAGWDAGDPRQVFALARVGGVPVGCGAIRPAEDPDRPDAAELLRMYSAVGGLGTGRAVLEFLQDAAARAGYRSLRLETRRANTPAVAFYLRHGYAEREPYGRHIGRPEAICLQKDL
jgi:GNAT superfamily N-acetyltransferase